MIVRRKLQFRPGTEAGIESIVTRPKGYEFNGLVM